MFPIPHRTIALLSLIAVCATAPVRADAFLDVLDDVPVMPGLVDEAETAVAFESAAGRIVMAQASAPARPGLDAGAVLSFYRATLPSLGWRAETPTRFLRDGEVLTLGVAQANGRVALRFELRPDAANGSPPPGAGTGRP
jgi:hypothetical protein